MVLVSLAGPLTNFLMAFLGCILYLLIFGKGMLLNLLSATAAAVLYQFLRMVITINLGLGLFNLIPIPPLDGSKVLGAVLPERQYFAYMRYERYGMYLLVGIMLLQNVAGITILPLGAARNALLDLMLRGAAVLTGVF